MGEAAGELSTKIAGGCRAKCAKCRRCRHRQAACTAWGPGHGSGRRARVAWQPHGAAAAPHLRPGRARAARALHCLRAAVRIAAPPTTPPALVLL